jgi:hypothetical protein
MKSITKKIATILVPLIFSACEGVNLGQVGDVLNQMTPPTESEAANGLKEALKIGLNKGVSTLSVKDGFWGDVAKRILLPPEVQKIEKDLRALPFVGGEVDKVIKTMNEGAENAVGVAKDVFIDAVTKMTVQDALGILTGGDGAATEYLKKTTSETLRSKFKPVVQNSLDKVGATKHWSTLTSAYNVAAKNKINTDLNAHVTEKAMTVLFQEVEKQENLIRADPLKRTSDLLKKVFGYADTKK